ncbi:MAG: dihydropteroate synthase [Actinomycetota bacterium]|nr:dihydropteroate synthase [Actinomycetota bacterium]
MISLKIATGRIESPHCLVMGVVNRTPDSFYDGGRLDLDEAVEYGRALVNEGANLLDLGGVKAGPGEPVSEEEEAARLLPLVEGLTSCGIPLSVETGRPAVAAAALDAGAAIVNDVTGIADFELAEVCAAKGAALVVMHHGGQVRGRPRNPRYADVVTEVRGSLADLVAGARSAGVDREAILVDPGLDFGKTTFHSLELIRRLDEIVALGPPVLVAPSRKDVVGEALSLPLDERLEGTLALVALSVVAGAAMVRVHDVRPTVRVVAMVEAVSGRRPPSAPVRGLWD